MATGRIGVTPTLRTRWSKQPSAGTTSLSGLDDNSVSLVYDVGYEAVYRNGVLLSRGNDYTATSGTSITLIDATLAGDVIEVLANQLVPLTDAISKGQFTAKGSLLSATAASTPAVLTVGSNNQVLTADSSTATGLKWAAASSKVVQIVTASTTTDTSSSSITFADTTLTATITPTSASNNILVFVNQNGLQKTVADSQNAIDINLYRGATLITTITQSAGYTNSALQLWLATASTVYLDSPATTSPTTYKTQFRNPNNSAAISVQKSGTRSTITLMEVTP